MIHHFFFFVSLSILFVHENTGKLGYTSDIAPTTPTIVVNVSWNETVLKSKTITTLQVVANPMLGRESPIHDQAWESLSKLNASFVRLALWFPYPKMGVAQLTPPSGYYMCGHLNGDSNANNWTLTMKCPPNSGVINKIDFGYWQQGTEKGECGDWKLGDCYAANSTDIIKSLCMGKTECTIAANIDTFKGDPCYGIVKELAVQMECSKFGSLFTNYDFTYMDQFIEDFMESVNPYNETNKSVMLISTIPNWMFVGTNGESMYNAFADSPYDTSWSYEVGDATNLTDPSGAQIGEYFNRIYQYYTQGGFYDEYNQFHSSPYHYVMDTWEVLNEPEGEYHNTPQSYTILFDAITQQIGKYSQSETNSYKINFMGLALGNQDEWNWYSYFLNSSNHYTIENYQNIDFVSFHFYAGCNNRSNISQYTTFFTQADTFVDEVTKIISIRDQLSPNTKLSIDEMGVILPNDNTIGADSIDDKVYFNAAGAMYAYCFAKLSLLGVDILGESQLMGFPAINATFFKANGKNGLSPQFPSVSMLNWQNGIGNARYWILKLLIEHFKIGDSIVKSNNNDATSDIFYYQGFISADNNQQHKILMINKQDYQINIQLNRDNKNQSGILYLIDQFTGDNDAQKIQINSNVVVLNPFAVAVFYPQS